MNGVISTLGRETVFYKISMDTIHLSGIDLRRLIIHYSLINYAIKVRKRTGGDFGHRINNDGFFSIHNNLLM